ncbi:MAG TPA: hypothetical protein DDW85_13395 [Porphyromonadaceae bacterium]|nr:hypothetical protein [Porphyromonadaceae bacterium]
MRLKTIEKLCCPFDKADLQLTVITTDDTGEKVIEGFLICNECQRLYPIMKGIPIMNPDEFREFDLERPVLERWQRYLDGKTIDDTFRVVEISDVPSKTQLNVLPDALPAVKPQK